MSDATSDRVTYDDVAEAGLDDWRMLVPGHPCPLHAPAASPPGCAWSTRSARPPRRPTTTPTSRSPIPRVDVTLTSHDVGRVTHRDFELARRISEIAAEQGVGSDPSRLQQVELGLDSPDEAAVQPFWRDLLAYRRQRGRGRDQRPARAAARRLVPGVRAARSRASAGTTTSGCRGDQVQARIDAVVAGGGRLVAEYPEHSFWVLEDAQGNRSCVCTAQGR